VRVTYNPAAPAGERYADNLYYCDDCGQPCEVAIVQFVRHHPWGDEPYEAPASACCHGEYQQGCALNFFDRQQERDRLEREALKYLPYDGETPFGIMLDGGAGDDL
jgi:hypothetical protein